MRFHFLMPRADGTVYQLTIPARDMEHAFEVFNLLWFEVADHTRSIGVWREGDLIGRVLVVRNGNGEKEPFLQELKP